MGAAAVQRVIFPQKGGILRRRTVNGGATLEDDILDPRRGASPEEALCDYRSRDQAEKLFDSFKNELGQRRLRTGIDQSAEGRLLLAFAALVLHTALEDKMRRRNLLRKMTVAELLAQMRKIKSITTKSGKRVLLEIPKRPRELLACLGTPLPE